MRNKVVTGFEEDYLRRRLFRDVEILLSIFADDQNLINASVYLIVTVLRAVEAVIGVSLKHRSELNMY